jgi:hypothetical protein
VLRDLVLARIIEPTSKLDAAPVLAETEVASVSYRTIKRRLPVIAKPAVRQALSAVCTSHAGLGPASLVLFDVTTLYFETDTGDGFSRTRVLHRAPAWNRRSPSGSSPMRPDSR